MAEPYFQFKQFRVYHADKGFKVGTDGVMLGAWSPVKHGDSVLDIGTGTGLIALMLAQRARISVDAVEMNPVAAEQARMNVMRSPFTDIRVYVQDVAHFVQRNKQYDLVVCNPPFFSNTSPPRDPAIHMAKHMVSLTPEDLFTYADSLLVADGRLAIIFPKTQHEVFFGAAERHGFHPKEVVTIRSQPGYPELRLMVEFRKADSGEPHHSEMLICRSGKRNDYSVEFMQLTQEFFLRF